MFVDAHHKFVSAIITWNYQKLHVFMKINLSMDFEEITCENYLIALILSPIIFFDPYYIVLVHNDKILTIAG